MMPRMFTADNPRGLDFPLLAGHASMMPRMFTADNPPCAARTQRFARCFNDAADVHRGYLVDLETGLTLCALQ